MGGLEGILGKDPESKKLRGGRIYVALVLQTFVWHTTYEGFTEQGELQYPIR